MNKEKWQWTFDIAVYATLHILGIALVGFILYGSAAYWLGKVMH